MLKLIKAVPKDASFLAKFAESLFRQTFEKDNRPEDMNSYLQFAFNEQKQLQELQDPQTHTVLAYCGGILAGYYQIVKGQTEPSIADPNPVELKRLYVHSDWHGNGFAQILMENAMHVSAESGFKTLWLGVWEKNLRAQAFYRKCGFKEVGSHLFSLGSDVQRDLVYQMTLPSPAV